LLDDQDSRALMKDLSGRKSEGAFTFVELMAAIAIILLLATMASVVSEN
jgi:prepilin-type N-terminal cleavage/methylation domain-containing protein